MVLVSILFYFFGHTMKHVGSQFPQQESNLCPLPWKQGVNYWTTRKVLVVISQYSLSCSLVFHQFRTQSDISTHTHNLVYPASQAKSQSIQSQQKPKDHLLEMMLLRFRKLIYAQMFYCQRTSPTTIIICKAHKFLLSLY